MRMFRFHREYFEDSMATLTLVRDRADLEKLLHRVYGPDFVSADVVVEPYGGIDRRNGWNTHLVSIKGSAVGMLDGAFES